MRNYFTFDSTPSTNFGVYISGTGVYNAPIREYDPIAVPGRDGDILGFEKRLANLELIYPAFIYSSFSTNIAALRDFLLSRDGYKRLTDTYHTDEYRIAYYAGGLETEMLQNLRAGRFDITFMCKPQRYLTSGETATTFTSDGTISNPTNNTALPLIRIYGTGIVGIGDNAVTVSSSPGYVDVDCEIMEAYYGQTLLNDAISVQNIDFPVLKAGNTGITLGTGITKVEITPRWWRL